MASRKKHCQECLWEFGEDFDHVHKWLDELGHVTNLEGVSCLDVNHRWKRHHKEGVEEVRKMWGDDAALAAIHHIKMDMGEVYTKEQMIKMYGTVEKPVPWDVLFG